MQEYLENDLSLLIPPNLNTINSVVMPQQYSNVIPFKQQLE